MKLKEILIVISIFGIGFMSVMSCKKNTDCVGTVICQDSTGTGINGAQVYLYANVKTSLGGTVTADIRATGVSDEAGKVSFTFKLPAIYDVMVIKTTSTSTVSAPTTHSAVSIIKLEEGKTIDKTVVLR